MTFIVSQSIYIDFFIFTVNVLDRSDIKAFLHTAVFPENKIRFILLQNNLGSQCAFML